MLPIAIGSVRKNIRLLVAQQVESGAGGQEAEAGLGQLGAFFDRLQQTHDRRLHELGLS